MTTGRVILHLDLDCFYCKHESKTAFLPLVLYLRPNQCLDKGLAKELANYIACLANSEDCEQAR